MNGTFREYRYAPTFEPARRDPWRELALRAQTDPEVFFPEKGGSNKPAKKVCMACPVRAECLADALADETKFGVLGGMSERERRKLIKAREAA